MNRKSWLLGLFLGCCGQIGFGQSSDPVQSLKSFSEFQQADFKRLLAGDIDTERGSLMNYPNGISVESLYAVPVPADKAALLTQIWDPSPHSGLKVYEYHSLHDPVVPADFQALNRSHNHSLRGLLEKSLAVNDHTSGDLNLSHAEAGQLATCLKTNRSEENLASCWINLLMQRVQAVQNGYKNVLPYDTDSGPVFPLNELRSVLIDQSKISAEFAPILNACGLMLKNPNVNLSPYYYWSYFDADHHDTLNLGVIYRLAVGDHFQLVDVEYFTSGSYFGSVTLYEVWPITDGNKTGALIWQGDLLSAPMLAYTKGTERIAYGALMLQDIKKSIKFFQDDVKGAR